VSLVGVRATIVACEDCPRLRRYCARIARERSIPVKEVQALAIKAFLS